MSPDIVHSIQNMVAELLRIKNEQGEAAYREAIRMAAATVLATGDKKSILFFSSFLDNLDLDFKWADVVAEMGAQKSTAASAPEPPTAKPLEPDMGLFLKALQGQLPGIKSQAQYTAFNAGFEAFRAIVNGITTGNAELEVKGKEALAQAFEVLRTATSVTKKLEDVPEAATSAAAEDFKRPPAEFMEYDVQRALLSELERLGSEDQLNHWYNDNRRRVESIKTSGLRNALFDAIRAKKVALRQAVQA